MAASALSAPDNTVVEVPRVRMEESHGTTLGRSVSEIDHMRSMPSPRRISPVVWIVGAGAVGALCLMGWGVERAIAARTSAKARARVAPAAQKASPPPKPVAAPSAQPAPAPPEPEIFEAETSVTPKNATIDVDGTRMGTGSFSEELPKDGRSHKLTISAPGYDTVVLVFRDAPPPASVELVPTKRVHHSVHRVVHAAPHKKAGSASSPHTDNRDPWAQ
jgi:hypothetical protein